MSDNNHDEEKPDNAPVDSFRRKFLINSARVLGGVGVACALVPLISSLKPNRRNAELNGPLEIDVSSLNPGEQMTVGWRGKPIWVLKRTQAMIHQLFKANPSLRDPDSLVPQQPYYAQNPCRSIKPDFAVLVGVCTHLGCTPHFQSNLGNTDAFEGFVCPCHGSRFDLAGRVYKHMPAPINLEVPPYHFAKDDLIVIGENP